MHAPTPRAFGRRHSDGKHLWREAKGALAAASAFKHAGAARDKRKKLGILVMGCLLAGIGTSVSFQVILRKDPGAGNFCAFANFCYIILVNVPHMKKFDSERD